MEATVNKLPVVKNPPKKRDHVYHMHLEIPFDLLDRMVEEAGVVRGKGREFVLAAIENELNRRKEANHA